MGVLGLMGLLMDYEWIMNGLWMGFNELWIPMDPAVPSEVRPGYDDVTRGLDG